MDSKSADSKNISSESKGISFGSLDQEMITQEVSKLAQLILLLVPVIVPLFIFVGTMFTSFVKGFVYIGFLMSAVVLRSVLYYPLVREAGVYFCGFGTYVLSFSMGYVCFPMFSNADAINAKVIFIEC